MQSWDVGDSVDVSMVIKESHLAHEYQGVTSTSKDNVHKLIQQQL